MKGSRDLTFQILQSYLRFLYSNIIFFSNFSPTMADLINADENKTKDILCDRDMSEASTTVTHQTINLNFGMTLTLLLA